MSRFATSLAIALSAIAFGVSPAAAQDGSFERTLDVAGPASLRVETGSGSIAVRRGDAGRVEVRATLRVNRGRHGVAPDRAAVIVRQIEADPPVRHEGSSVSLGQPDDDEARRVVSISYDVRVPADTEVHARSGSGEIAVEDASRTVTASAGSGDVVVRRVPGDVSLKAGSGDVTADGVGGRATLSTGSGDIDARDVKAGLQASSGSGDIVARLSGPGEITVSTGSGDIRVEGVRGGLRAKSGSGSIAVDGSLDGDWSLEASSGDIGVQLPADAAYALEASTSSGEIEVGRPIAIQRQSRRGLSGTVGGGGRALVVHTASGNITIR